MEWNAFYDGTRSTVERVPLYLKDFGMTQQTLKEQAAEKKINKFHQYVESENNVTPPPIQTNLVSVDTTRLEKLKLAINKAFYLSPNEISLSENIRSHISKDSDDFIALKKSIASDGILQPVVVELRDKPNFEYSLIAVSGHRRILAAQEVGLEKILCIIKKYEEDDSRLLHGLTENLLRTDLDPMDIAEGYKKLIDLEWRREDVAEYFGKDQHYISNIVRVANYPEDIKKLIRENKNKFSMRVLVNEFSKKTWKTMEELKAAIMRKINPAESIESRTVLKSERNKKLLSAFYQINSGIPEESKIYIEKALKHFKLIY